MGRACEIVNEILEKEELWEKFHLIQDYKKPFEEFNLLIGANGAGKTRLLTMIKEYVNQKPECKVLYLDFSNEEAKESYIDEDFGSLIILGKELPLEIYENFLGVVRNNMEDFMGKLTQALSTSIEWLRKDKEKEILGTINRYLPDILGRSLILSETGELLFETADPEKKRQNVAEEFKRMSPGERNIMTLVLIILVIKTVKRPAVLLVDEIETHLHPAALIKVYHMLQDSLGDMDHCTCLASHSIFLLAQFEYPQLVFMDKGHRKKIGSSVYRLIYDNLVSTGDKDSDASLSLLLESIDSWQFCGYLAECFRDPEVEDKADKSDPQYLKLKEFLHRTMLEENPVEILDFGSGSGRIAQCMESDEKSESSWPLAGRIKYHIYDAYSVTAKFEENQSWHGNIYKSREELDKEKEHFDLVLLYNVLHEIGIDEWEQELNRILHVLKPGGALLFSERKTLSVGEKPYGKSGYLILNGEELQKLFAGMEVQEVALPEEKPGPVYCYYVRKRNQDEKVEEKGIQEALEALMSRSIQEIRKYRVEKDIKMQKARNYAFYCQQYVNAQEALDIISCNKTAEKTREAEPSYKKIRLENILNSNYHWEEKLELIKRKSQDFDEEGKKCKDWLSHNQ